MSWLDDDDSPVRPPLHDSSRPRDGQPRATDPEALRQWHADRMARRLHGEYESAVVQLTDLITHNLGATMRIAAVRVHGAHHTRPAFLDWLVSPLLAPDPHPDPKAHTLERVLHTARRISARLDHTDLFRAVDASLERSRSLWARDGDLDLVFRAKEKGRLMMKTSTEFGNGEGSASISGRVRNLFGLGTTLEANVALGTQTRRAVHTSLLFPLTPDLRTKGELSAFLLDRDNTSFASSTEGLRGLKAVVRTGNRHTLHELGYEAVLRHVSGLLPAASLSIRSEAGHTFKSAFSYTLTRDTRDDKVAPARGSYLRLVAELAGAPSSISTSTSTASGAGSSTRWRTGADVPSVAFAKGEAHASVGRQVLEGVNVTLSARGGLLYSLHASGRTAFADRFQLGGPTNMRMFRANSMGPRDGGDSLGGELYYALGLSVLSSIPRKPHWPLKTHLFLNAGRLDALDRSKPLSETIRTSLRTPSVSAGVGLLYTFNPVRLEVNFGVPLVAARSDGWRRGFQVGMGLEFL